MISQKDLKPRAEAQVEPAPVVLTETDKFYIEAKVKEGATIETLEKSVGKPQDVILAYINTLSKKVISQFERTLGKQTVSGRKAGTTVMTQASAQASDEASKPTDSRIKYTSCITKIRNDD